MYYIKNCRVCLIQNVKMYKYDTYNLKTYYLEIMDTACNDNDEFPLWFCFECAILMQKYHNFKKKCQRGHNILKELIQEGPLTSELVSKVDRGIKSLNSPLQLTSAASCRVKTFVFQYEIDSLKKCTYQQQNSKDNNVLTPDFFTKINPIVNENKYTTEKSYHMGENDEILFDVDTDLSEIDKEDRTVFQRETISNQVLNNADHAAEKTKQGGKTCDTGKFKRSIKKKFLNPNHWKKFNLTKEVADIEFKAKETSQKYLKAKFKCSKCFRGFSQEEMLNRHMKIKHCKSLGKFECRFCHMRMKWKSRLQKHLKEHYTRYKCLRCELSFSVEDTAFKHDEFHNGVTRTCPHCGEQFKHSSSFYTHLRKHRSKYVCTLCGISFLSEFGLYMHKKVKHILTNPVSKTEENMFCDECDIKFETRQAYEEHLTQSTMHSIVLGEEDCIPQPLKWPYTQRRVPRKYTNCSICSQNFSTYAAYSKHHLADHSDVPLIGNPYKSNMRKICEICGVSVAPVSLASHINTHMKEKCHTCNVCGMQLSSKSGLNRHRLTHSEDKPTKCDICDKRFAHTTNMKLHCRTVHFKDRCLEN